MSAPALCVGVLSVFPTNTLSGKETESNWFYKTSAVLLS